MSKKSNTAPLGDTTQEHSEKPDELIIAKARIADLERQCFIFERQLIDLKKRLLQTEEQLLIEKVAKTHPELLQKEPPGKK